MRFNPLIILLVTLVVVTTPLTGPQVPGPRVGGTFIGAIVAEDGIVLGSDSRSTFLDTSDRRLGYVDGLQKLYVSNTTGIAVSGLTSVEGELFSSFVSRNSFLLDRTADEVLFGFSAWLPFKNSTGVLLLSAGFIQGKPTICVRSVVQPQTCRNAGMITNKTSPSLQAWASSPKNGRDARAAAAAIN
jgi:hypothetical protein